MRDSFSFLRFCDSPITYKAFFRNRAMSLFDEDDLLPLDRAISFFERVQCTHWSEQRIVVALSANRVAKLTPRNDDRLQWERLFVRRVLNFLLDKQITPCVTRFISSVRCSPDSASGKLLWRHIARSESGRVQRLHQSPLLLTPPSPLATYSRDGPRCDLLGFVVERAPGVAMHDWAKQRRSLQQWRYVLFQLLYTLAVFSDIGLHHNDVHLENVFIDERGWPEEMHIFVDNETSATIPARREAPAVRLIDFDKASLSSANSALPREWQTLLDTNPNLENNLCTSYGLCNHHRAQNNKFDAFTLLCTLLHGVAHYNYQVPSEIQRWIKDEAMPRGKRLYDADFEAQGGFLCRLSHHFEENGTRIPNNSYVPSDDEQRPTDYLLLESTLFQPLLRHVNESAKAGGDKNIYRRFQS